MDTNSTTDTTAAPAALPTIRTFPPGTSKAMRALYGLAGISAVAILRGETMELLPESEPARETYAQAFKLFAIANGAAHMRIVMGRRTFTLKREGQAVYLADYPTGDPVAKSLLRGIRRADRKGTIDS